MQDFQSKSRPFLKSSHSDGEYEYQQAAFSDADDDGTRTRKFDEFMNETSLAAREKSLKTGRQRKRLAARSKGGEFAARRQKRRVYFCCISSDIDILKLFDHLSIVCAGSLLQGWKYQLYPGGNVVHLYKQDPEINENTTTAGLGPRITYQDGYVDTNEEAVAIFDDSWEISAHSTQEVFVFDFGATVFWGFSRGEENNLLQIFKLFVTRGRVDKDEFSSGEDDMAFTTSPGVNKFTIANDFITLSDHAPVKQRLSISFAIAQSSILSIFEARIARKVEEYRYIPQTLAAFGKVNLTERQLGIMIGEVFVVRHDVNLHTEILDTPAFFWKEERFEQNYETIMNYLEMDSRTNILNKRLDMLRELLDVLQHQMENEHGVKLEWIVIWLIVVEVAVQLFATVFGGSAWG